MLIYHVALHAPLVFYRWGVLFMLYYSFCMKIVSWNVNGLRAVQRNGLFKPFFDKLSPDIVLLQEIKAKKEQLSEEILNIDGYYSYFNSPKTKAGYSGTAVYTKKKPEKVTYGMDVDKYDDEGRIITAFYKNFIIVNIYFPNGGQGPDRLKYKLEFYEVFLNYVNNLNKKKPVIWGGDVNTAHEEIDLTRYKENKNNTGFLPEERAWLDEVVASGWVDTFRYFYPEKANIYSYWDMKTKSRDRNVGWRIDYIFVSQDLINKLKKANIHNDIFGSDHCPVSVELEI